MAGAQSKKDHTLKDMFIHPSGRQEDRPAATATTGSQAEDKQLEALVTRSFFEALFTSFRDDLHSVKKELSQDLKVLRMEMSELGGRVPMLEDRETPRDEEIA
ncbi:hypothetical protein NDU88_006380 [Pleurodeles waltl]|uniref:Uncharacterized protein n=1 Tax=Pleurodeles waltl TaxID=8319 RepID=A0AAV7VQK2_PLEWA|nr:hypothetical protein NDU88_006380 [Pleurodeles waltl]